MTAPASSVTRRLVLCHNERERYVVLEGGAELLIGRAVDAGFFLNDASISRKHCKLRATQTGVEVEDLASRNACFLNGRRVVTRTLLVDGGVLQVGQLAFTIRFMDKTPEVPCSSCAELFEPGFLTGSADGLTLCSGCLLERNWGADESQLTQILTNQGFHILEALGGIPACFKVERQGMGKTFHVKAITLPQEQPERADALREGARALASLEHRAITEIIDLIEVDRFLLIVMQHDTAVPLASVVPKFGPLGPRIALHIARECAEAIGYASACGLVHREIVPANILVGADLGEEMIRADRPGRLTVRVTNFGIARDLDEVSKSLSGCGDVDRLMYVAPELLTHANAVDERTDVFGVGVVLFYALTGRPPWGTDAPASVYVRKILSGTPVRPVLEGVLHAPLRRLLDQLLADRGQRLKTGAEAVTAIEAALQALGNEGASLSRPAEKGVLQGGFSEGELVELLQLWELNRKSGEIEIWGESQSGKVVICEGRIHSARLATGAEGLPAARILVAQAEGRFRAAPSPVKGGGLAANVSKLLLDVLRERDEGKKVP